MRKYNQAGATLIGLIFTIVVIVSVTITALRLTPIYIKHYNVVHALKSLKSLPKASLTYNPKPAIFQKLQRQFNMNYIENPTIANVSVRRDASNYLVNVKYDEQINLVANIDLIIHFNTEVTI